MSRRRTRQSASEPGAAEQSEAPELGAEPEAVPPEPVVEAALEPEPAAPAPAGPPGKVWCEAISTILTPGEPTFAGGKFWLDAEAAERLRLKGHLRIL